VIKNLHEFSIYFAMQDLGRDEGVMSTYAPRLGVLSLQCLAKQDAHPHPHTDARVPSAAMSLLLKVIMITSSALL
jgi:hypothetical protein